MGKYIFGKNLYFDYLIEINYLFFNDEIKGSNLRELDDNIIKNIDNKIGCLINTTEFNYDEKIAFLFNTIGYIWFIQPFLDGNTRTLLVFMKWYLNKLGYDIDYTDNILFPIFYHEDDSCTTVYIDKIKRRIKKSNSSLK